GAPNDPHISTSKFSFIFWRICSRLPSLSFGWEACVWALLGLGESPLTRRRNARTIRPRIVIPLVLAQAAMAALLSTPLRCLTAARRLPAQVAASNSVDYGGCLRGEINASARSLV